jgi:hypothetical protein
MNQDYSVAKRPLKSLPAEQRQQIALEVLQAYSQGEEVADLAPNYGVSDVTLYALLIRDHEAAWVDAQRSRAVSKRDRTSRDLEELRAQLRSATQETEDGRKTPHDMLSLARIKEQVKLAEIQAKRAEWELERVFKRIYGQDVQADQAGRVSITLNIGGEGATNAVQHGITVDEAGKPVS